MGFSTDVWDLEVLLRAKSVGMGAFKEAENGLLGVTKAALAVSAVAGVALAVFTVESLKHMEEVGHEAFEMSKKFGLLPNQASAWVAAGSAVGVAGDQMSIAFKFAAKNMELVNLAMESGHDPPIALIQAYKDLGVQITDVHGNLRPLNDVMLDVATAFRNMPDGAEKAGLAVKLFGRSGTDVIPILDEGAKGIQEYMDKAKEMGAVLSDDQVKAAQQAYLAQKQLDLATSGLSITVATTLMPTFIRFVNWLVEVGVPAVKSFFQEHLIPFAQRVAAEFQADWPAVRGELLKMKDLFDQWWPTIQKVAKTFWDDLQPALKVIRDHGRDLTVVVEAIGLTLLIVVAAMAGFIAAAVLLIAAVLKIKDAINAWITGSLNRANDSLVHIAQQIFAMEQAAITAWWTITHLGNPFQAWNPPGIPLLPGAYAPGRGAQLGGLVWGGTGYLVGERGPEYFTPSQTGRIVPNDQLGNAAPVINITAMTNDPYQLAEAVGWQLRTLRRAQ